MELLIIIETLARDFARRCAPLDELRNHKGDIKWTDELIQVFEEIKQLFATKMELVFFDPVKPVYYTSDACDTAISAWIGQFADDGKLKPIMCVSKKLNETQQRWSTTKKELNANLWGMIKLREYLTGRLFINRIDHKSIERMLSNAPNHLLQGWMDDMLSSTLRQNIYPAWTMSLADALSRQYDGHTEHYPRHGNFAVTASKLPREQSSLEDIVPEEERKTLIEKEHLLGHFSLDTMMKRLLASKQTWKSMRRDIGDYIKRCIPCARYNTRGKGYHPLNPISALFPWDHIEIDLIGPFPNSEGGYEYIITVTDVLSNFTIIRPLKSKSAKEVATRLWEIICDFGPPKIIQSDQGKEFVNSLLDALTTLMGIDHRLTTAYHPRANGLVERRNKDITLVLKKLCDGTFNRWDEFLPIVQYALNRAITAKSNSSPADLMFARKFNDLLDYSTITIDPKSSIDDVLANIHQYKTEVLPHIRKLVDFNQQAMKTRFDDSHTLRDSYAVGDVVFIWDEVKATKLSPQWLGPFRVSIVHGNGSYSLTDNTGEPFYRTVTTAQMKPFSVLIIPEGEVPSSEIKTQVQPTPLLHQDKSYVVQRILDHKETPGHPTEYLVKWKGYTDKENSWTSSDNFDDVEIIRKYHQVLANQRKATKKVTWKKVTPNDKSAKTVAQPIAKQTTLTNAKTRDLPPSLSGRKRTLPAKFSIGSSNLEGAVNLR